MKARGNNKALIYSIIFHAAALSAAWWPLAGIRHEIKEESEGHLSFIEIAFEHGDMSPERASSMPGTLVKEAGNLPGEAVERDKVPFETFADEQAVRDPEQAQEILVNEPQHIKEETNPVEPESFNKMSGEEEEAAGKDSERGEGENGMDITGKALAHMDFDGDGVFGRRVIYHADIARLAEKEGRVVVNLCINRAGRVTHAAFNRDASSLTEYSYVKRVLEVASLYRFESDYEAPELQCGKLTFIFEIDR